MPYVIVLPLLRSPHREDARIVSVQDRRSADFHSLNHLGFCLCDVLDRAEMLDVNRQDVQLHRNIRRRDPAEPPRSRSSASTFPSREPRRRKLSIRCKIQNRQRMSESVVVILDIAKDLSAARFENMCRQLFRGRLTCTSGYRDDRLVPFEIDAVCESCSALIASSTKISRSSKLGECLRDAPQTGPPNDARNRTFFERGRNKLRRVVKIAVESVVLDNPVARAQKKRRPP